MKIWINQNLVQIEEGATLDQALEQFGAKPPFAVALNGVFIHRSSYSDQRMRPGDQVDIVQPVAGG